jgi:hypothetical protein
MSKKVLSRRNEYEGNKQINIIGLLQFTNENIELMKNVY